MSVFCNLLNHCIVSSPTKLRIELLHFILFTFYIYNQLKHCVHWTPSRLPMLKMHLPSFHWAAYLSAPDTDGIYSSGRCRDKNRCLQTPVCHRRCRQRWIACLSDHTSDCSITQKKLSGGKHHFTWGHLQILTDLNSQCLKFSGVPVHSFYDFLLRSTICGPVISLYLL